MSRAPSSRQTRSTSGARSVCITRLVARFEERAIMCSISTPSGTSLPSCV